MLMAFDNAVRTLQETLPVPVAKISLIRLFILRVIGKSHVQCVDNSSSTDVVTETQRVYCAVRAESVYAVNRCEFCSSCAQDAPPTSVWCFRCHCPVIVLPSPTGVH